MKGKKAIEGALERLRSRPQRTVPSRHVRLLLEDSQEGTGNDQQLANWQDWNIDHWHDRWADIQAG
jgi:hypothetical protein